MSASAAVVYPSALRLGPEAREEAELEDVFVTDLDRDLPSPKHQPNGQEASNSVAAASISEEWRRLHSSKETQDHGNTTVGDQGTVVKCQPKRRSEDLFLQPSQVEEMLGQNSQLLELPGGGGGGGKGEVEKGVAFTRSTSSSSTKTNSLSYNPAQPAMTPMATPGRSRRPSLWDGIISCINPLMGTFKKDKRPSEKKDPWEIPFADIRELNFIGSGAQGAVFVGEYLREKVAVKKVKDVNYCQEARHLRKLNHPNIVKFKGVCTKPPCFCVILEYCPGGTLYDYIQSGMEILPSQVVGSARQIGAGMLYLHNKKIIHRDLKSLNILICDNNVLKIADFGVSRHIEDSTKMTFVGTVGWMSPEMIRREPCSEKVDVWSYGVLLWELLMQERPYHNVSSSAVIYGVGSNKLHLPIPTTCPVGLKVLLEMCWQPKPKNRPSFRQILMHLDLAAGAFLTIPPDTYLMTQENWRGEIEACLSKLVQEGIPQDLELVHQREEELRHAQDVRLMYEQKLTTADRLYKELRSCKMQLDARELELQRRERQLNEKTYKMKRMSARGSFPSHLGTPPRDCPSSDSTDDEVDCSGPYLGVVPATAEKSGEVGTPLSGSGKKKAWRKKRRCSASKEDKSGATGFSEKVTNSNRLTRKQTLPLLNTLATALPHELDCDPSTPTFDDPDAAQEGVSRDSTPRPKHAGSPITPNGSFSLEVSELLESVKRPSRFGRNVSGGSVRSHRRQGSNGSVRSHRRQGSNGSVVSEKGCSLETTPRRGLSTSTTATSSKRASADLGSSRRGSSSGIPYTRMDSYSDSYSEELKESPAHSADSFPTERQGKNGSQTLSPVRGPVASIKELYSNESSMDTQHESDGAGHDADGESTSDENRFYRFSTSGTEPNETQESNVDSSAASPSLPESDELASSSAADVEDTTTASANLLPLTNSEVSSQSSFANLLHLPSLPLPSQSRLKEPSHDPATATPTNSSRHDLVSPMVTLDTKYGHLYNMDDPDTSPETSITGLTMPLHLRLRLDNPDDGQATPTPATPTSSKQPKISSVTAVMRTFFDNLSNKPKKLQTQDSNELEDSGFQSPQAGIA